MKRMFRPALCLATLAVGLCGAFCKRPAERSVLNGGREQPAPRAITPTDRFLDAVRRGDRKTAEEQLLRGADPHAADPLGDTALMLAAERGDETFVRLLLARGVNRFVKDREGRTAFERGAGNAAIQNLLR